jgi:hypothetical protein
VPIVRTPARRNAFGRIDEDAVIDVGVPHATEEESVVEEGWEGVDEDESYQEADECGMVREECGREDRGGGRGREERRRLEGASSPTPPTAASVVVAGHLAFFDRSRRDISTYLSASSSFGGTPKTPAIQKCKKGLNKRMNLYNLNFRMVILIPFLTPNWSVRSRLAL